MRGLAWLASVVMVSWSVAGAAADDGRVTAVSRAPFAAVAQALERAIGEQKMALVCHANAQRGAAARGVTIKGNQAVRLLAADPAAGFEAPLRTYLRPSAVFAPYSHPEVRAVAAELDPIVTAIVARALAAR